MVRVTVEDGGPGVPERRCRTCSTSSIGSSNGAMAPDPGTGIGLAVVRGLTEAMGGTRGRPAERPGWSGHRHRAAGGAATAAGAPEPNGAGGGLARA